MCFWTGKMLNEHLVEKLNKFVATNPWLPMILEINWVAADLLPK